MRTTTKEEQQTSTQSTQELKQIEQNEGGLTIKRLTARKREPMAMPGVIDGFMAIVMAQGSARMLLNNKEYNVERSHVIFLKPNDEIYALECTADTVAYMLISSGDFMDRIHIDFSASAAINMRHGRNPILKVSEVDTDNFVQLMEMIKSIRESEKKQHTSEIESSLFTAAFYLLTDIEQEVQSENDKRKKKRKGSGEAIFNNFITLLNKYNKRERNVQFYSDKLGISTKYLSVVVKNISGKTAARWIDDSVILEAKALLTYSGLSINEIATELNFTTQSFFGKYFKQHTGVSPSRFKRK